MPNNIKSERVRIGCTQEDLAKRLGVSTKTVGNWERGCTGVPGSCAVNMAAIFDCSTDYLFALTDERKKTA